METMNDIDDLLARFFAEEPLTEKQQQELESWKDTHKNEFERLNQLMHTVQGNSKDINFDATKAWNKIEGHLKDIPSSRNIRSRFWIIGSIAASLLLVIVWSTYWFNHSDEKMFEFANVENVEKLILLPDSSEVTLSPNTHLTYLAASDGCRKVTMNGRAFFAVKKNGTRFQVHTSSMSVEVLGTSFLVDAVSNNQLQGVYVATGKVKVAVLNKEVVLHAQEKAELFDGKINTGHIEHSQDMFAPYHHLLQFEEAALTDIVKEVSQQTGVRIDIDKNLEEIKITTQIDLLDVESIIRELSLLCHCRCDTLAVGMHYKLYAE